TKSAPAAGLTSASVPFTLPITLGDYEVRFFSNNTFTKLATSPTVTVQPAQLATVSLNGGSVALTVAGGATVTVGVTNGPGSPKDWLALYAKGAPDSAYLDWFFLNGTKNAPAAGLASASVPVTVPSTLGDYELRCSSNNTFPRLALRAAVTV